MKTNFHVLMIIVLVLCSCRSHKNITYFQNVGETGSVIDKTTKQYEPKIITGDMLTIVVSALDPTSAALFNLPVVTYASPVSEQLYSQAVLQTYLVDKDGIIEFPILGRIKIGGMLKSEAISVLQELLEPYLKSPIVNIRIINYKIAVLGEVNKPGTFSVSNERITFLDALALAGDLTIYGKRKNVLIFRENDNGEKTIARIDLTTDEVFNTPYYYLQQNDIIYVEPNRTRANVANYSQNRPMYIQAFGTVLTTIGLIYSITK